MRKHVAVRCRCGKEFACRLDRVKAGTVKSYKEFALTAEQFRVLTSEDCHYCGASPSQRREAVEGTRKTRVEPYIYNGIDRINSALGYIEENCVACCEMCNRMKLGYSREAFIAHATRIAEHLWRS